MLDWWSSYRYQQYSPRWKNEGKVESYLVINQIIAYTTDSFICAVVHGCGCYVFYNCFFFQLTRWYFFHYTRFLNHSLLQIGVDRTLSLSCHCIWLRQELGLYIQKTCWVLERTNLIFHHIVSLVHQTDQTAKFSSIPAFAC